jgi:hypothetical protein
MTRLRPLPSASVTSAAIVGGGFRPPGLCAPADWAIVARMFEHGSVDLFANALRLLAQSVDLVHQRMHLVWREGHGGIISKRSNPH